jgi:dihydrofolate synthase/folylpolyglutamate synthase
MLMSISLNRVSSYAGGGSEITGMSYRETLDWLFPLRRLGSKRELETIRHLLHQIGDPQDMFRSILVTGTNGKGSTVAMVASILWAAGYKVGMFTSPHLSSFTERIMVNGKQIPQTDVVRIVGEIRLYVDEMARAPQLRCPTFFEITTAIAFKYFAEQEVDLAVIEVGMGGKLDATNVVHALVSVITNVGLEHTEVLGDTVLEIAEEKAGIIKENGVLITATKDDDVFALFRDFCERIGSRVLRVGDDINFEKLSSSLDGQRFVLDVPGYRFEELFIPMLGDHQLVNAATAVGAVEALSFHGILVSREAVKEGLRTVRWPGRLEVVQKRPLVVLDSMKDVEAARAVKEALLRDFTYDRLIVVVSFSSDKNIPEIISHLAQAADLFLITSHKVMGRAADPNLIAKEVESQSKPYEIVRESRAAIQRAIELAQEDDMVCIVGSVFLVGEARELWFKPTSPNN